MKQQRHKKIQELTVGHMTSESNKMVTQADDCRVFTLKEIV